MRRRCSWAENQPEIYIRYHDEEWGIPCHDDKKLFEFLLLEMFQAGLSWLTVLKKRENFRRAFAGFDVQKVASYQEADIKRLLNDAGIVRNRAKIEAAVNNAKVFIKIREEFGSFDKYLWGFTDEQVIKSDGKTIPARTPLSDTISKDLKRRGMKFVGSVIIYSYLQATGVVNDHEKGCFKY